MKNDILNHLDDPAFLEQLYRKNKTDFKDSFSKLYPEIQGNKVAEFWQERLNYESSSISWGSKNELLYVFIGCFIAGLIAKSPDIFSISEDYFFSRNFGFIVFPILTAYFVWKNKIPRNVTSIFFGLLGLSFVYINSLPDNSESDTLILACIHLPLILWMILGSVFQEQSKFKISAPLEYLRFNGDAAVMMAVLAIAGGVLTGITFGLFSLIGIDLEPFFESYILLFGLPAIPILATFLTQTNPQLVNKVSPIIAKLFSPVVLIMLTVYLIAIFYTGKDPYNDREFLLTFNIMLIGVMAIIFFSVAENTGSKKISFDIWVLFLLSIVTIIVNGVALSAIIFRISEWGLTPNRLAVLGANILILIHLLLVTYRLYGSVSKRKQLSEVGKSIVSYIPIYFIWILIVVFIFPVAFGFK